MNINNTPFHHLNTFVQSIRGLLPPLAEATSPTSPARVTMEPLMESLPTRRPRRRDARAYRLTEFMQMGIDS